MALNFVTRAVFLYQGGMPEPDSVVMAAGMAQWFTSHIDFGDAFLYGRQLSPGVYFLFRMIYPAIFNDASHIIPFLNWIGLISSTAMIVPLYMIFRKRLDRRAATGCMLLIMSSPLVWELGTYFHPIVPAALLMLLALITWERIAWSPSGIVYCLSTYILASASIVMRFEVLLIAPALLAAVLLSNDRKRNLIRFCCVLPAALVTYLVIVLSISRPTDIPSHGMRQFIQLFGEGLWHSFSFAAIKRSIVWAAFGIGIGLVLLSAYGFFIRLRMSLSSIGPESGRDMKWRIVAILWILPILVLWLPYPVPIVRHYFLIVPAAAWIIGETVLRRSSSKRTAIVVLAAVVCNLAVPEILYRSYNAAHPGSEKLPNGSFFYYHQKADEKILRNHAMQKKVLSVFDERSRGRGSELAPGVFVAVTWESYGYLYHALARTEEITRLPEIEPYPGMHIRRYAVRGTEIRLAFLIGYITDSMLMNLQTNIRNAEEEGFAVFAPEEVARSEILTDRGGGSVLTY